MKVFATIVLVAFVVCVGLAVDAWDDLCIRHSTAAQCE